MRLVLRSCQHMLPSRFGGFEPTTSSPERMEEINTRCSIVFKISSKMPNTCSTKEKYSFCKSNMACFCAGYHELTKLYAARR